MGSMKIHHKSIMNYFLNQLHQQEQQSLNANLADRRRKLGIRAEVWQHSISPDRMLPPPLSASQAADFS